jgi:hypothetical protein
MTRGPGIVVGSLAVMIAALALVALAGDFGHIRTSARKPAR